MPIIASISRTERRKMQKTIHKTKDKNHARRLTAMLMLCIVGTALVMLPERYAVPAHLLSGDGLTGSRCPAQGLKPLPSGARKALDI